MWLLKAESGNYYQSLIRQFDFSSEVEAFFFHSLQK